MENGIQAFSNTLEVITSFDSSQIGIDQAHREQLDLLRQELDKTEAQQAQIRHLLIMVSDRTLQK